MKTKKKNYIYVDSKTQRSGNMVCTVCNKRITAGLYRFYETEFAYLSQHRECTKDDKAWAELDEKADKEKKHDIALLKACVAFKSIWHISELDDLIKELRTEE